MDISRKTLIVTLIVNIVLIAVCVACAIITKFNPTVLWLGLAVLVLVLASSIMIWIYGKEYRK